MSAKVYLIDVYTERISEKEIANDRDGAATLREIYGLMGCDGFELGATFGPDHLFLEDSTITPHRRYFRIQLANGHFSIPLGGNGLLVGADRDRGGSFDPKMPIADLRRRVIFLSRHDADAWAVTERKRAAMSINGTVVQTIEQFWREKPFPTDIAGVVMHITTATGIPMAEGYPNVWTAVDAARQALDWKSCRLTNTLGEPLLTDDQMKEAIR